MKYHSEILQGAGLRAFPGIDHGFFTAGWGACALSVCDRQRGSELNRKRIASTMFVASDHLVTAMQVHSGTVAVVNGPWAFGNRAEADALVTNRRGLAIGVLTADCVPVLCADPQAGVVAAVHAGRKGVLCDVVENAIAAMEKLGARHSSINAALGPCIWQASYEVGPEILAAFMDKTKENQRFFRPSDRDDHYHFDLPGCVKARLLSAGVKNIDSSPANTYAEPKRFFSRRFDLRAGQPSQGNLMSAIALI